MGTFFVVWVDNRDLLKKIPSVQRKAVLKGPGDLYWDILGVWKSLGFSLLWLFKSHDVEN